MKKRDKELAKQAGFNSFDTECYEGLDVLIDLVRADERERIKAVNAPEIERINYHIKDLEDRIRARGNT